jgi:hypothetical protein
MIAPGTPADGNGAATSYVELARVVREHAGRLAALNEGYLSTAEQAQSRDLVDAPTMPAPPTDARSSSRPSPAEQALLR